MRVAIIILGVIGLLFLGFNKDQLSSGTEAIPKEGPVLHSKDNINSSIKKDKVPLCPKCKKGDKIVQTTGNTNQKICRIHETTAINL